MNFKRQYVLFFIAASMILPACSSTHKQLKSHYKLHKITEGKHRSPENRVRNTYRNPVETLRFFEVEPNMKVVEVSPGGGWYTEILGPYLKQDGELFLTLFSEESKRSYAPRLNTKIQEMTNNKDLFGTVHFSRLETPLVIQPLAPEGSVDRVLTFRNTHTWMADGQAKQVFEAMFKALKPGGILGLVQHRAKPNKKQDPKARKGYVREDYVIDLVESAGFEFVAKSEINANYNDPTNHKEGVWTLPPSLRLKEKNRSRYLAIGESDRMTLKFKKPAK